MNVIYELGILLALCLTGEVIASLLPFTLPASVASLILLIILLLTGIIKESYIKKTANFFLSNMTFFFVPSCIGIMQYFDLIGPQLVPFALITVLTIPLIYFATGWSVQLMMKWMDRKGGSHD